jgi:hypothetical protein
MRQEVGECGWLFLNRRERGGQKQALGRPDAVEVTLAYTFTFCPPLYVNGCRGESG